MIRRNSIAFLMLLCLAGLGYSEDKHVQANETAHDAKLEHELYYAWHNVCLSGDTDTIDAQINRYEAKVKSNHGDQLARAYLGSAHALRAKASLWPPAKIKHIRKGQSLMDEAVQQAPHDPRVRMIRAIGSYKVPKRFGRRKIALTDFEKLIPIAASDSSGLMINERQVILYYAWLTFKEEHHPDASKAKKRCHALAPDSKYGKLTSP